MLTYSYSDQKGNSFFKNGNSKQEFDSRSLGFINSFLDQCRMKYRFVDSEGQLPSDINENNVLKLKYDAVPECLESNKCYDTRYKIVMNQETETEGVTEEVELFLITINFD